MAQVLVTNQKLEKQNQSKREITFNWKPFYNKGDSLQAVFHRGLSGDFRLLLCNTTERLRAVKDSGAR